MTEQPSMNKFQFCIRKEKGICTQRQVSEILLLFCPHVAVEL
jgi:hypothetical protein